MTGVQTCALPISDSLTIFLQQLGRGLRLSPGKTELTTLDFVAQAHKKYDFASKFRALTLRPEKNIAQQIANGFTLCLPVAASSWKSRPDNTS